MFSIVILEFLGFFPLFFLFLVLPHFSPSPPQGIHLPFQFATSLFLLCSVSFDFWYKNPQARVSVWSLTNIYIFFRAILPVKIYLQLPFSFWSSESHSKKLLGWIQSQEVGACASLSPSFSVYPAAALC